MPEPIDVVEALLFASETPVEADRIQEVLDLGSAGEARELVRVLSGRLDGQASALQIIEVGGGYRLVTRPDVAPWLVKLARSRTRSRLSRSSLETLAIVAYRQPVSRPDIDAVRGVNSEAVLDNLLDRRMIRIAGRKDSPGRPFLYETTRDFLVAFGLRDLTDLPKVDGELVIPEAPTDATGPARAAPSGRSTNEPKESYELTRDMASGGTFCWKTVNQSARCTESPAPASAENTTSTGRGRPRPMPSGCSRKTQADMHEAASGLRGRTRIAIRLPTRAPMLNAVVSAAQAGAPPRSRFATIGPSTKYAAKAKLPIPKKTIVVQIHV